MGKSRRAKALDIPRAVKDKVAERDGYCCIICGKPAPSNAHYIARSQSGLGIEENIVTLCLDCHSKYDHGIASTRALYKAQIREYLQRHYPDWNEEKLKYNKWEV